MNYMITIAKEELDAMRKRIADLEEGMAQIAIWSQEDQDDHETCAMQWRGCVATAQQLLETK